MKRITILLAAAALALAVSVPAALAKGGDGTRIVLKASPAFPSAKGSATFNAKPGERQLEVEVEHLRRLAGKRVAFFAGGTKLGTARINALGKAQIERRNSAVPAVRPGTLVTVKTVGGILIVRGSF